MSPRCTLLQILVSCQAEPAAADILPAMIADHPVIPLFTTSNTRICHDDALDTYKCREKRCNTENSLHLWIMLQYEWMNACNAWPENSFSLSLTHRVWTMMRNCKRGSTTARSEYAHNSRTVHVCQRRLVEENRHIVFCLTSVESATVKDEY